MGGDGVQSLRGGVGASDGAGCAGEAPVCSGGAERPKSGAGPLGDSVVAGSGSSRGVGCERGASISPPASAGRAVAVCALRPAARETIVLISASTPTAPARSARAALPALAFRSLGARRLAAGSFVSPWARRRSRNLTSTRGIGLRSPGFTLHVTGATATTAITSRVAAPAVAAVPHPVAAPAVAAHLTTMLVAALGPPLLAPAVPPVLRSLATPAMTAFASRIAFATVLDACRDGLGGRGSLVPEQPAPEPHEDPVARSELRHRDGRRRTGAATTGSGAGGGAGVLGTTEVTAGVGGGGAFSSTATASRSICGCTAS